MYFAEHGTYDDWMRIYRENPEVPFDTYTTQVIEVYERIKKQYAGKKILIVAHSGTFRVLTRYSYDLPKDETMLRTKVIDNCGLIVLPETPVTSILDKWILSELQKFILTVKDGFERYDLPSATRAIAVFLDTLTNFYIRRSRRRFWRSASDTDKISAYETLYRVLTETAKAVAPILPFVSEEIYRGLTGRPSVHLEYTPLSSRALVFPDLDRSISETRTIITLGLALRARKKLRVRQPLASITIGVQLDPYYEEIIRDELNVKEIIVSDMDTVARRICRPDARRLGPRLGARVQEIIRLAKAGTFTDAGEGRVLVGDVMLEPTEYEMAYEPLDPTADVEGGAGIVIALDTHVSPELTIEGYARDLVRAIQEARRTS